MTRFGFVLLLCAAAAGAGAARAETPRIGSEDGWSLKPRGFLQWDVGHLSRPAGIAVPGLGTQAELRRARLGIEGTMPGGFGFLFEIDAAGDVIEIQDATLSYRASPQLALTAGQHNGFQSLEELTSDRFTSFVERAAFTDAFGFERRIGLSGTWVAGPVTAQLGVFHDNFLDLDAGDGMIGVDGRLVFAPRIGDVQLHLGGSAHWRDNGAAMPTRYRQRPLLHATEIRFIETPPLPVGREWRLGLEAALIRGPFHLAGEAHWLTAGTAAAGDPGFFGFYAEAGWFLTGETRGYRDGRWDRTRVRRPVGEGGLGAVQLVLRYDRLDLDSGALRGGTQDGLQASLIWLPTDHTRLMLNYGRLSYDGAAIPAAGGDRSYRVDVVAARAQIDF
jgi:phosphate-selective porin OprO/OprP